MKTVLKHNKPSISDFLSTCPTPSNLYHLYLIRTGFVIVKKALFSEEIHTVTVRQLLSRFETSIKKGQIRPIHPELILVDLIDYLSFFIQSTQKDSTVSVKNT